MPADVAGFVRLNVAFLVGSHQLQQRKGCHLRVSNKRKAANVWDGCRWDTHGSTKLFDAFTGGINVVDTDISEPVWLYASVRRFIRKLYEPRYRGIFNIEQGIRPGHGHFSRAPAHDVNIKGF